MTTSPNILKTSATTSPVSLAGAIAAQMRERGQVELHAVGAGAINQAVKAIAISRGYLAPGGMDVMCIPSFIELQLDGEERTGIRFMVLTR